MIYGIVAVLIFSGILIYLDYRVTKLENHYKDHCLKIDLLIMDYLKRNKKKITGVKIDKDAIDGLFK